MYKNNCSFNEVGIYLHSELPVLCSKNRIIANTANNNTHGIHINRVYIDTSIINNTANNNRENGIYYEGVVNTTISGNIANNNKNGIYFYRERGNQSEVSKNIALNNKEHGIIFTSTYGYNLTENVMKGSGLGIYDFSLEEMSQMSIDTTNTVNGNPIYFYINETNLTPDSFSNAGQIILYNCNDSVISNVDVSNCSMGISVIDSNNVAIENSVISNNLRGMYIWNTNNSLIKGNLINDNYKRWNSNGLVMRGTNNTIFKNRIYSNGQGIYFDFLCFYNNISDNKIIGSSKGIGIYIKSVSSYNIFSRNLIKNNGHYGIIAAGSHNNLFYENFFINNTIHVYGSIEFNTWNNTLIGNYWDDYAGIDGNGDGIGDTPYHISTSPLVQDFFPIVDKDPPEISVLTPQYNSLYGVTTPSFNLSVNEKYIDRMWYSLDGGLTNISLAGFNETIDQAEWDKVSNGTVNLRFYVKDKVGQMGTAEVMIRKDINPPLFTIHSPSINEFFGTIAPSFNVEVLDYNLDLSWYTLNGGALKYYFITNGLINQTAWSSLLDGPVLIEFFANDTLGNIVSESIIVHKDTISPLINILTPQSNDLAGKTPLEFNVEILDTNLDQMWYTIQGSLYNITLASNGTIDQSLWDKFDSGNLTLIFYANDSVGHLSSDSVQIIKDIDVPLITINYPKFNEIYGFESPNFNITVIEPNIAMMWYTLNNGMTNLSFTELQGNINQTE